MAADPERSSAGEKDHAEAYADLKRRRSDASATQQMFALSGIGFEFIAEVGAMTILGWWLDKKFESSPWCTIAGVAIGFTFGIYRLVKFAKKNMQ